MGKKKQLRPYKYEVGDTYQVNAKDGVTFTIKDRKISYNEKSKLQYKEYLCECNNCHYESWHTEKYIVASVNNNHLRGNGCKMCGNIGGKNRKFENVISKTDPWAVSFFKVDDDANRYTAHSHAKTFFICPYCGHEKYMEVREVIKNKQVSCPMCGDGYSYPNKYAYALFSRLPVEDLKREYNDNWTEDCRYDISFYYMGRHYLVEMDGAFHYYEKGYKKDLDLIRKQDNKKNELAEENGCILIRIDSRKSELEYLKNNIINSDLGAVFDFSNIDWDEIDKECIKTTVISVCEYYRNITQDLNQIAERFGLNSCTVRNYLKRCTDLGLIDYKTESEIKEINVQKVADLKNANPKISIREMCNILEKHDTTVRNYYSEAVKRGLIIDGRSPREIHEAEIQDIIRNNPNRTKTELCKLANCCLSTLNNNIEKMTAIA